MEEQIIKNMKYDYENFIKNIKFDYDNIQQQLEKIRTTEMPRIKTLIKNSGYNVLKRWVDLFYKMNDTISEKIAEEAFSVIMNIKHDNDYLQQQFKKIMTTEMNRTTTLVQNNVQKIYEDLLVKMIGESNRTLTLMNNILENYEVESNFKTSGLELRADLLVEMTDILEKTAEEAFSAIMNIKHAKDYFHQQFKKIMTAAINEAITFMQNNLQKIHEDLLVIMIDTIGELTRTLTFKASGLKFKAYLLVEIATILEIVADCIDEINGIKKFTNNVMATQVSNTRINGSWNRVNNIKVGNKLAYGSQDNPSSILKLLSVKDIKRPQESFTEKIDNSNDHPWEPKIKEKPNSLKPLAIFLEETERGEEFSHPYEFELDEFSVPEEQLLVDEDEPVYPKPLEDTNLIEVDTEEKLRELVEDLRNYKMIAIDLEHHSYRTFMGITCLMQISTGDTDYIIDTLILRDKLFVLNEIFTKPSILKIFHGANSDILWLQRDLSLYIVNMFDTYQAAKLLGYASLSLASLLKKFCNFTPNKHFQMADWRMRPLPDALKKYAREDTHYLIYIHKVMKNELLKKSNNADKLLKIAYERSTETCKKRYFKPRCTDDSYMDFYRSCKRIFDKRQLFSLKGLYNWRDRKARDEDESIGYVLPGHMLLEISETLPREMQGILACCNPVPPLVRSDLLQLHHIILKARDVSVDQPILQEDTRARGTKIEKQIIDLDNPFYSPFYWSNKKMEDEYDYREILKKEDSSKKSKPIFWIFDKENGLLERPLRNRKAIIRNRYRCRHASRSQCNFLKAASFHFNSHFRAYFRTCALLLCLTICYYLLFFRFDCSLIF